MWQSHDLKEEVLKKLNENPKAKSLKMKSLVAGLLSSGLSVKKIVAEQPRKPCPK